MKDLHKKYLKALSDVDKEHDGDQEYHHRDYDKVLCELLIELGYGDVIRIYESAPKWFA